MLVMGHVDALPETPQEMESHLPADADGSAEDTPKAL
jgi:hypothetical protein